MASPAVRGPPAGGIGEAPLNASRNSKQRGHARTQSSSTSTPASPSALDKFVRALLPQSAFPSHLAHHPGEGDGIVAKNTIAGGTDLSRTSSAASSAIHPFGEPASPSGPIYASPSPGKSRNRVPTSTIGAGKAAHAHRHNLSIDSSTDYQNASMARTRSRTGVANSSAARAASPASFHAGGIGESPARSRQNSASSSTASTNLASSMFSHRQTSSTSTQQDTPTLKGNKTGSSRLNSASTTNTVAPVTAPATATIGNNTLPSIRGYTTFPDSINLSSTRPRTPLLDPFMRNHPGHPSSSGPTSDFYTSSEPPRIGLPIDEPRPSNSYVASLALAPLVSRPTQGGQPLYISGGRTPETLHAAPSSTYSTPNLHASPSMQYMGSGHTMPRPVVAAAVGSPALTNGRALNANAGLGLAPSASTSQARPAMRHRSSSVDSFLPREEEPMQGSDGHGRRHDRQHSSGLAGFTNFFHLRNSNSADKSTSLSRRGSSRDNTKSRSRKGSLSNTVNTGHSGKISSRFVHYGQPSPGSRPRTPASETRTRQRSSSFGGAASRAYEFPERDSPTQAGGDSSERGRLPRGYNSSRSNSAVTASSSLGRRQEEKRKRNKLVSARLPESISHRDARLPSQPLGFTWICGYNSTARTPSFYEEFDYSKFPGGKRKRSISRSTITQRNYSTTTGGLNSRAGSRNGTMRGSDDLAYESEPEFLARQRARSAGDANAKRSKEGTMVDEQTQTTPQGDAGTVSDGPLTIPHLTFPSGGGALLTSQEEERAPRRRSQSLVNLRRDNPYANRYGRVDDGHTIMDNSTLKAMISQPYRDFSNEFIRTPRTAPVPSPGPGDVNGSDVPPLSMGDSALSHDQHKRRNEERVLPYSSGVGASGDLGSSLRRAPSRASIEAIEDPDKRKEALFAALPPPARRSPTPASALSPSVYSTGKVPPADLSTMPVSSTQNGGYVDYPSYDTQEGLNPSDNRSGAMSPPVEDYSHYEASRVIIGQSDLLSSATAQERFPVVYGQAFSTTHESHEGEILSASTSADDLYAAERLQREDSRQSGATRDSLTPLRDVESSMTVQRPQYTSGSAGSESASRSISNGSARILDLNEESFTNLFFKAPPPSKPLPSLPSSDSNSRSLGGSGSRLGSTSSPVRDMREGSPAGLGVQADQRRPDSMTPSDRFPTPDFSVLDSFDVVADDSELLEDGSKRDSRRETLTHPFARVTAGHPSGTAPGSYAPDDDWANVDDDFLRGDRQIWPPVGYEEEDDKEVLLQPPPMARKFTNSTARTVDTFYTAGGGGPSNASTSAFQAPALSHQESFASARSHITASSAARTPQAEISQPASFTQHRGQFIDDGSDDDEREDHDTLATMRRTDLSPIYVQRSGIPPQFLQQHSRESSTSPATGSGSQSTSARLSNEEAFGSNRESFIEFEPVVAVRPRAASDTRSFIDDDSDDDEGSRPTQAATGPASTDNHKINRPSVIVEHLHEDEQGARIDDSLSPDQATSPYLPLYAATSPSHYSVTPSEIIDAYGRRNDGSSGGISRDSQGNFSLGLPSTSKGGDRSSGGSHARSVSNISILSSLSRLEDFPEPPPSITPAYEKDEATAMMRHRPSISTSPNQEASGNTRRPRDSSLHGDLNNQSRATIDTQGTQNTSIHTFTSSADNDGKDKQADDIEGQVDRDNADQTTVPKRGFEFPMRSSSKRTTVDSFLDTTTSPERGSRSSFSLPRLDSSLSSTSHDLVSPTAKDNTFTPSPSQQSFRSSGFFGKGPIKHERTSSDPTALSIASSRNNSLNTVRRGSGGFENQEEKRQSWKGF